MQHDISHVAGGGGRTGRGEAPNREEGYARDIQARGVGRAGCGSGRGARGGKDKVPGAVPGLVADTRLHCVQQGSWAPHRQEPSLTRPPCGAALPQVQLTPVFLIPVGGLYRTSIKTSRIVEPPPVGARYPGYPVKRHIITFDVSGVGSQQAAFRLWAGGWACAWAAPWGAWAPLEPTAPPTHAHLHILCFLHACSTGPPTLSLLPTPP